MDAIRVHSPATVSNVVCGFDCLGFALSEPYDDITLRLIDEPVIRISHNDSFGLPTEPERNVAGVALRAMLDAIDKEVGFDVEIAKGIKPGSGIGSSAASACGAVVAANELLGRRFSKLELIEFAMAGEMLASGSRHADNLAPCIFGGFVLVRSSQPLDVIELDHPPLFATVLHPQIEIKTSEARAILPREVPLAAAVRNWSNLGAFVAALNNGDTEMLSRAMRDEIIEPARSSLIPGFDDVKNAGIAAGAIGGGISGSGPSMFMISATQETAQSVAKAMSDVYSGIGIEFHTYVSAIDPNGVKMSAV
ncbi:MAG: homoserine kinase [Acidobacteriota bacterium]|nr:MAG: homoserine kinase [Acidobacteriota bacterium]